MTINGVIGLLVLGFFFAAVAIRDWWTNRKGGG